MASQRSLARISSLVRCASRRPVARTACTAVVVPASARRALSSTTVVRAAQPAHAKVEAVSPVQQFIHTDCGLYVDRTLPTNFNKILIANRGEIACRVIRTARQLGVKTVAVYSDVDAKSMHVQMADEAYRIGEAPAASSYLSFEAILDVAKRSGAQAIHPGYGFLSENAHFAEACEKAGVVFIGPPASAIHAMGSKSASKQIMTNASVPVVPGYHGDNQDPAFLKQQAGQVGYPIMLKAVLGGGGKGMRIVWNAEEFDEALDACKREALNSFKDERVLLERYIQRPRHIEFQVFADQHGHAVHLFERDCSVQRRHQKVLEEAPAPGMTPELRRKMGQSAVDAAKAVGYVGAGTVEFIFDAETDEYFFMEMNTRLQVEHPVSEMIMRRDLVQWQLHVAAGHAIPVSQATLDASANGHALEARIYAENPTNNFLPATGKLVHLRAPEPSKYVRVETGVREGDEVSIFYDPMISKLCVWAPDRRAALKLMSTALDQYQIVGPPTNIAFLQRAVNHPDFAKGKVETGFIAQHMDSLMPSESATAEKFQLSLAVLALLMREKQAAQAKNPSDPTSPFNAPNSIRLNHTLSRPVSLFKTRPLNANEELNKQVEQKVSVVTLANDSYQFTMEDGSVLSVRGQIHASDPRRLSAQIGDQVYDATIAFNGPEVHVFSHGTKTQFNLPQRSFGSAAAIGAGCVAPMAGKVVKVQATPGSTVKKGTPLVIMEAMKMEHVIRAPKDGVIDQVMYKAGDFVDGGKVVVSFVTEKEDE